MIALVGDGAMQMSSFDGALAPRQGALATDRSRPGMGLALERRDLERYKGFEDREGVA